MLLLAICCWWHLSSQVAGLHRPATVRCPHLPSGAVRPHSQLQGNAYRVSLIMSSWSLQGKWLCCSGEIIWAAHEAFNWSGPPCHYCLVGMNWCLVNYQPTIQLESHSFTLMTLTWFHTFAFCLCNRKHNLLGIDTKNNTSKCNKVCQRKWYIQTTAFFFLLKADKSLI